MNDVEKIIISVKGSGENKEEECAWACKIDCVATQNKEEKKDSFRMEMYAVLNALRAVKAMSIPAEIRTNSKWIAQICQEIHEGQGCRAENNLDLWDTIEREIKVLNKSALTFEFKSLDEKDSHLKSAGKIAHDRTIE